MQRLLRLTLVWLVVLAPASLLCAQGRGGGRFGGGMGGDMLGLLTQKSVQEELKLSDDQKTKGTELAAKQHGGFQGLRDLSEDERRKKLEERAAANQKSVAEILQPEQLKRLKQISLQQQGAFAFEQPEVASALQLTNDQKDKLKAVQQGAREKMRAAFQGGQPDREKMQAARKAVTDEAFGVLTEDQKSKWKELTGSPFTGEIVRPTGDGGNGGRRRREQYLIDRSNGSIAVASGLRIFYRRSVKQGRNKH